MTVVKRGDGNVPLTATLGVDLTDYTDAAVILRRGDDDAITVEGTIDGQTVTCTLTSDDTAVAGDYRVEVEMTPGPHTYPSTGYVTLRIVEDLG